MRIIAKNLDERHLRSDYRKVGDTFVELEKDPLDPENRLTYSDMEFSIPSRVAGGIARVLDWQNGENPDNDGSKYPERHKKWFDRRMLGDCHNFAWMAATGSLDAEMSTPIVSSSFLMPEQMAMAGFREIATVRALSPSQDGIVLENSDGETEVMDAQPFESRLLSGDVITLYHYDCHQQAHSFVFLGIAPDGFGRYLQRVGRGGHLSVATLWKTMRYYPSMMGKKGMVARYSKIYRDSE